MKNNHCTKPANLIIKLEIAAIVFSFFLTTAPKVFAHTPEPTVEIAQTWWTPQENVWTPLGWKDHLFRLNVLYNGTLLYGPLGGYPREFLKKYDGLQTQISFATSLDGSAPGILEAPAKVYATDGGVGLQGWDEDHETPILWTKYPRVDGVVIKQEVFTHLKGGQDIKTGAEPLYSWIRLSVSHVDPFSAPYHYFINAQFSNLYISNIYPFGLDDSVTLKAFPAQAPYTDKLGWTPQSADSNHHTISWPDGKVRAIVFPQDSRSITFAEASQTSGVYNLTIDLPTKVGAYVDLLVPYLPEAPESIAPEITLGREKALAQAEEYWSQKPATAARIHTPENYINQALRRNIQFAQLITERVPTTGDYTFLSGSYGYDALWSTPTSMISHMFLDLLGYHDVVDRHIDLLRKYQGTIKPPGEAYTTHPGYLGTPKFLKTYDWLADHGANMEAAARHALLSADPQFIDKWTTPILAACQFVKDSCSATAEGGISGLMPPAVSTDTMIPSMAVWNQAWIYKGLVSSVEFLKSINHPDAAEFEKLAVRFKARFQDVYSEKVAEAPKWTDSDGARHPVMPTNLLPAPTVFKYYDVFQLDTGPLVLPFAGLMDADDPLMKSFAEFFRTGPNTKLWGPRSSPIARPVLHHEISSCEPCYSWNIVNSAKSGDRLRFLQGMYSLFTGAISNNTYINGEHRHAMYGTVFVAPLMTWSLRHAVIDDELEQGELHLLRLVPLAWLSKTEETVFENMPTLYGPVDLRFKLSNGQAPELQVSFKGRWRNVAPKVVLHAPPLPGLEVIEINGVAHDTAESIVLD